MGDLWTTADRLTAPKYHGDTGLGAGVHGLLLGRSDADSHPASAISNVPAGNITAATVQLALNELDTLKVGTTDPRLSDARTPLAHVHAIGDVTGLTAALLGKSDVGHTHTGLLSGLTAGYLPKALTATNIGDGPLYTDGTNLALGHSSPSDALHIQRTGSRAGLYLEGIGAGGYAAMKMGSLASFSEFLVTVGNHISGFEVYDTNAAATRLSILTTTGYTGVNTAAPARQFDVNGIARAALEDLGGQVFSAKAYGVTADGTTDDTTALGACITAAAAVKGVVQLPTGIIRTTGNFNLNGLSGLKIRGNGPGATIIRMTHATNDLFYTTTSITDDLEFSGFSVTSDTVTRTGGWVFRVNDAYNGTGAVRWPSFQDLEITKQFHGLGVQKFFAATLEDVFVHDPAANTTAIGVQFGQTTTTNVNQGAGARCRNVLVYGKALGAGVAAFGTGILIEDCEAVSLTDCDTGGIAGSGLKVVSNAGGHAAQNHFFTSCVFDSTDTGHSAWVTGTGDVARVKFTGCWFAAAGGMTGASNGNGLRIDAASIGGFEVVGGNFYNNRGTGLYISSATASGTVSGNTFYGNGIGAAASNNDGIYVGTGAGNAGPAIVGNFELGSNGASIRTGANADGVYVGPNSFATAPVYGTFPKGVYSGSYTPSLTNGANVASSSDPSGVYARVDNTVTFSGSFLVTCTAAGTRTSIDVSLPIPSNLSGVGDLAGTAARDPGAGNLTPCLVMADAVNNRATIQFDSGATAALAWVWFHATYKVI